VATCGAITIIRASGERVFVLRAKGPIDTSLGQRRQVGLAATINGKGQRPALLVGSARR
jgi:hypothetical protein